MELNKDVVDMIVNQIKNKCNRLPEVAIILGSGLSGIADAFENKVIIPYDELEGMLIPNVEGHKNQFIIGEYAGKTVIALQGRFHLYNGFTAQETTLPIYIFKQLGVKTCILTNAAGAINKKYKAGDLVLIKSHINLTGQNPLIPSPLISYGEERFIDLSNCYDREYRETIKRIAKEKKIKIYEGIFLQDLGPCYETPAEVDAFRKLGADAVAMSSAIEAIACNQVKLKTIGFSCISNKAASFDAKEKLSHQEVLEKAVISAQKLQVLIYEFIQQL